MSNSSWCNWNNNNGQKSIVIPECQICSKRGHTTPNCYYRNEQQLTSLGLILECQICGKKCQIALNCYHSCNCAFLGSNPHASLIAMTAQFANEFNPNQAWIMDIGATHYVTGDMNSLNMLTPFEGSGECLLLKNTVSSSIVTTSKTLNFLTVLHVP